MKKLTPLILAEGLSSLGSAMMTTTLLMWLVLEAGLEQESRPAVVATYLTTISIAVVVVGPFAGAWVDRLPKIRVLIVADLIRAIVAFLLVLLCTIGGNSNLFLVGIFLLVAVSSSVACLFIPARTIVISRLSPDSELEKVFSRLNIASTLAGFAGPTFAAVLVSNDHFGLAMSAQVLSFLSSLVLIQVLKSRVSRNEEGRALLKTLSPASNTRDYPTSILADISGGMRIFFAVPALLILAVCACMETITSSAFNVLNVFFYDVTLGVGATWFGYYESSELVGILVGSWIAVSITSRLSANRVFAGAVVAAGLFCCIYPLIQLPIISVSLGLLIGMCLGVVNATFNPIFIRNSDPNHLGQMVSMFTVISAVCGTLSTMVWGVLASTAFEGTRVVTDFIVLDGTSLLMVLASVGLLVSGLVAVAMRGRLLAPAREVGSKSGEIDQAVEEKTPQGG